MNAIQYARFENQNHCNNKNARPFLNFPALMVLALAVSGVSQATTLDVSISGQFGAGVIADSLAAPGESWSLSFDVDSPLHPTRTRSDSTFLSQASATC